MTKVKTWIKVRRQCRDIRIPHLALHTIPCDQTISLTWIKDIFHHKNKWWFRFWWPLNSIILLFFNLMLYLRIANNPRARNMRSSTYIHEQSIETENNKTYNTIYMYIYVSQWQLNYGKLLFFIDIFFKYEILDIVTCSTQYLRKSFEFSKWFVKIFTRYEKTHRSQQGNHTEQLRFATLAALDTEIQTSCLIFLFVCY